jgi:hypothetical protein
LRQLFVALGALDCQPKRQESDFRLDIPDRVVSMDRKRHSAAVRFVVENETGVPLWVASCMHMPDVSVYRFEKETWVKFAQTICPGSSVPVALPSGGQYASVLVLAATGRFRITASAFSRDSAGMHARTALGEVFVR